MFLKHLTIQNFKGLVHCEVDLEPGFNLLIGDNGKGKTSILEAASVALGGSSQAWIISLQSILPNPRFGFLQCLWEMVLLISNLKRLFLFIAVPM